MKFEKGYSLPITGHCKFKDNTYKDIIKITKKEKLELICISLLCPLGWIILEIKM